MADVSKEQIRDFLIDQVEDHPRDLVSLAAETFGLTRQAVHRHLSKLVKEGAIEAKGATRNREYALAQSRFDATIRLEKSLQEDVVWRTHVEPHMDGFRENIMRICYYGFTEIFNNAIDHSDGNSASIEVIKDPKQIEFKIHDDGVGIFEKISKKLNLTDKRHAILELAKGKLTTDPARHSGEGIFFTSRMFDSFAIVSKGLVYVHQRDRTDFLVDIAPVDAETSSGTLVKMSIDVKSTLTPKQVFDQYTNLEEDETYGFSKTAIPLNLARFGTENLISRSQAKRVLNGIERFREVVLDFKGIDEIGQAFADEIFRVFARDHPHIQLEPRNATEAVTRMIRRAQAALKAEGGNDPSASA